MGLLGHSVTSRYHKASFELSRSTRADIVDRFSVWVFGGIDIKQIQSIYYGTLVSTRSAGVIIISVELYQVVKWNQENSKAHSIASHGER